MAKQIIPFHEMRLVYQVAGMEAIKAQSRAVCTRPDGSQLLPAILQRSEAIKTLVLYYTLPESKSSAALWQKIFGKIAVCAAKGGLDRPNINQSIDRFVARARAAQAKIEVFEHTTGQHGFDVLDDDSTSREIIAKTIAFVKAHT
jgi:dienelactone hydrolase